MTMTIEERAAQSWDAWGPYKGPWNEFMEWQLREAVAEAVAAKDAELAALRQPVAKVTEEESAEVHRLLWAIGSGDGFSAMAAAIDKLIEPRVASAVAAEQYKHQAIYVRNMQVQKERHAAELAQEREYSAAKVRNEEGQTNWIRLSDYNRDLAAADQRHVAELAAANKAADDEWIGKFTNMANRLKDDHAAELAKQEAKWVKHASHLEGLHACAESTVLGQREMLKESDQRWQAELARVKAEHAKEIAIMENACKLANNLKDSLDMRTSKAVAAAYEELIQRLQKADSLYPTVERIIRQLAAKPREASGFQDGNSVPEKFLGLIEKLREIGSQWLLDGMVRAPAELFAVLPSQDRPHECSTFPEKDAAPLLDSDGKKIFGTDGELMTEDDVAPDTGEDERPPICQVCGWRCAEDAQDGCVPGNCSMRPIPKPQEDAPAITVVPAPEGLLRAGESLMAQKIKIPCPVCGKFDCQEMAKSQGLCDTTKTERLANPQCRCGTYADNPGPCNRFYAGGSGRCVYCDHEENCHISAIKTQKAHECSTFPECECGLTQAHDSPSNNRILIAPCPACGLFKCPSVQFVQDICWRVP